MSFLGFEQSHSRVARQWTLTIDLIRANELLEYSIKTARPIFEARPGIIGVQFFSRSSEWITLSTWQDSTSMRNAYKHPELALVIADMEAFSPLVTEQNTVDYKFEDGSNDVLAPQCH